MANFATAALVKAQAKLIGAFQTSELRFREPAVHKLFLENTKIMLPDYMELRTREDRVVETNYVTRTARALGTGRTHNHTGAQGDSAILTPTWATYNDKFVSTIKEAGNKIYTLEEMHMSKLQNVVANFAEGLESVAAAYLFANRTGVNGVTTEGTFDAVDDTFEITESTNGDRAVQITKMVMDLLKYKGNYTIVCDSIAWNKFGFQEAQGSSNDTNTSFQFSPNVRFVHDASLTAAAAGLVSAYAKGYWIVVPDGTIAALPWIPVQNRQGYSSPVANFGSIMNPVDALSYALHTYMLGVDGTGDGGYTQDVAIETEISIDVSYTHAPSSTATESPLTAFALV